jgi:hypothetical protein
MTEGVLRMKGRKSPEFLNPRRGEEKMNWVEMSCALQGGSFPLSR